jgi:hypothetical protein
MASILKPLWGPFFKGAFLPQKLAPKTYIETRYNSVQRHVLSYQVKTTPGWFVWAAPTLRTGAIIRKNEENSLNIRGYREKRCKVLAARRIFSLDTQDISDSM